MGRVLLIAVAVALSACGSAGAAGPCSPGARECRDGDVWSCRADGTGFDRVVTCPVTTTTCVDGSCVPLGFHDAVDDDTATLPDTPRRDLPAPEPGSPEPGSPEPAADVATDDGPPELAAEPTLPDLPADPGAPDPGTPEREEAAAPDASPDPGPAEPTPEPSPDVASEPAPEPVPEVIDEPVTPGCGDGVVQAPEACEPGKPLGKTCAQVGYESGTLGCHPDCSFDTSGCDALGAFAYEKIQNLAFKDDFVDVAWRADGVEAYFVRADGGLVRYDPTTGLLAAVELPAGLAVRRVVPVPFEPALLLAGAVTSPATSFLFHYDPIDGTFTEIEAFRADGYEWIAGRFSWDGKQFVAGGRKPSTQGSVLRWSAFPFAGDPRSQWLPAWPNLHDVVWRDGGTYGVPFVTTSEGVNGAHSRDWILATDLLVDNGWKASFGNPARGEARPGGATAVFAAMSTTNKLYVYDGGTWSMLEFQAPYFSAWSVAWNAAGTRMLVVGRVGGGSNLVGSVHEYRPTGTAFAPGAWVDQSIPDFDAEPWVASSNTYFFHAAFRPHSDCTEGLLAGSDNGTSWSPTFGLAVRFHDTADPACE